MQSKTVQVDITDDDIANGSRCSAWNCPIQRGVTRATGAQGVAVYPLWVAICDSEGRWNESTRLPAVAARFISDFDRSLPVQPISFELCIPVLA
jgi:hypothetical protein